MAGKLRVTTDKAVKPGRPIYLNYDPYPSHTYLLRHGFTPISNIHDCLLLPLPPAPPLLAQVLRALEFPAADAMCLDVTRFLNDRALAYFLLRDASPQQLQQCLRYAENTVTHRASGWEAAELRRCALGVWDEESKTLWDGVKAELQGQLAELLRNVTAAYSSSIARDHVVNTSCS